MISHEEIFICTAMHVAQINRSYSENNMKLHRRFSSRFKSIVLFRSLYFPADLNVESGRSEKEHASFGDAKNEPSKWRRFDDWTKRGLNHEGKRRKMGNDSINQIGSWESEKKTEPDKVRERERERKKERERLIQQQAKRGKDLSFYWPSSIIVLSCFSWIK